MRVVEEGGWKERPAEIGNSHLSGSRLIANAPVRRTATGGKAIIGAKQLASEAVPCRDRQGRASPIPCRDGSDFRDRRTKKQKYSTFSDHLGRRVSEGWGGEEGAGRPRAEKFSMSPLFFPHRPALSCQRDAIMNAAQSRRTVHLDLYSDLQRRHRWMIAQRLRGLCPRSS